MERGKICLEAKYCGDAKLHYYDPKECLKGHCGHNKSAECLEIESEVTNEI